MTLAALPKDYDMRACPFCGQDRVRLDEHNQHGKHWLVRCLNLQCNARGPRRYDPDEALSAWNERR